MSQLIDSLKIDSGYLMGWSDGAIVGLQLANRRADKIKMVIAVGANNGIRNMMVYQKEYFPTSVYSGINIPVMIVLGDRDMISIEHGLEMYRLIKKSQYCVLPNTTHEVFDERPDIISQVAIDFFK